MSRNHYSSVSEAWQMLCPGCERDDSIRIHASVEVLLVPLGTESIADASTTWDNHSRAYCYHCGHGGILQDFRNAYRSVRSGPS